LPEGRDCGFIVARLDLEPNPVQRMGGAKGLCAAVGANGLKNMAFVQKDIFISLCGTFISLPPGFRFLASGFGFLSSGFQNLARGLEARPMFGGARGAEPKVTVFDA
jgi:hypothetical protein